ncbi:hypothetical protein ACERK3_12430 [Phycisphaerales bacterium AB-hyl4]|uniref:Uncharacterized protein n=1 Tax=Natronomicrosphaera hydrolytica TaxID=3242702 RepID=A0ABV4U664_9BACT
MAFASSQRDKDEYSSGRSEEESAVASGRPGVCDRRLNVGRARATDIEAGALEAGLGLRWAVVDP